MSYLIIFVLLYCLIEGRPIEVHGWDDNLKLGQVSAVDVNLDDNPVIFQRGPVVWNAKSFDMKNVLREKKVITEDTILTIDADKGKVKSGFGSGLFYMPHGLKIDHEGNTWVTDVGMHQVFKFNKGETMPSLGNYIFKWLFVQIIFCSSW